MNDSVKPWTKNHLLIPLILVLSLLAIIELTGFDFYLQNKIFDFAQDQFSLRQNWFLVTIMHDWVKRLVILLFLGIFATWLVSFFYAPLKHKTYRLGYLLLAMASSALLVSVIKQLSSHYCPWDLKMYGGQYDFVRLFSFNNSQPPGKCWPGGHASTAFSLFAFYFYWIKDRPKLARIAVIVTVLFGAALSISQTLRGAHFISHNIWTGLICWLVCLYLYKIMLYKRDFQESRL